MGDCIPVYFGAVAVDPTFQARDAFDVLMDLEEFEGRKRAPQQGWYCTVSKNYWLQHVLDCLARHFRIPGLEFNYPVRPGTRHLTSGCSVLDGLQVMTAQKGLGEIRQRIEGGIPPLGEFDAQYFDELRQRFEPGGFQKAAIQEKIEINDFGGSYWGDSPEDQAQIFFCSYVKTLDHALSQVEGDKKFVFVLACPWGP